MIIDKLLTEYYTGGFIKPAYVLEGTQEDKAVATSYLGTPVFSNLVFEPVSYRDFDDNQYDFDGATLDVCLIQANCENVIVETAIQGRSGSVKELISGGDYRITVNGFLLSENQNVAPYIMMAQFLEAKKVTTSIKVVSAFLNSLDVYEVVVNAVNFSEIEGTRNMIAITMNLTSETPIEIRLA